MNAAVLTIRFGTTEHTLTREDLAGLPGQVPDVAERLPGGGLTR